MPLYLSNLRRCPVCRRDVQRDSMVSLKDLFDLTGDEDPVVCWLCDQRLDKPLLLREWRRKSEAERAEMLKRLGGGA